MRLKGGGRVFGVNRPVKGHIALAKTVRVADKDARLKAEILTCTSAPSFKDLTGHVKTHPVSPVCDCTGKDEEGW